MFIENTMCKGNSTPAGVEYLPSQRISYRHLMPPASGMRVSFFIFSFNECFRMDVHDKATPARMLQSGGRSYNMSHMKGKAQNPKLVPVTIRNKNQIRRICISIENTISHQTTNPADLNVCRKQIVRRKYDSGRSRIPHSSTNIL